LSEVKVLEKFDAYGVNKFEVIMKILQWNWMIKLFLQV